MKRCVVNPQPKSLMPKKEDKDKPNKKTGKNKGDKKDDCVIS